MVVSYVIRQIHLFFVHLSSHAKMVEDVRRLLHEGVGRFDS